MISSDGEALFSHPAPEGTFFSVKFIHSVNQSPVAEIFEIRNETIKLSALEFEDFGAGMPTDYEIITLPSGRMRIENFDRATENLNYIVGRATELVLYIENMRVPLSDIAEPGTLIEVNFKRLNFWNR